MTLETISYKHENGDCGNAFENHFHLRQLHIARQVYAAELALFQALQTADFEGVLQITVQTRTQTITLPISGDYSQQIIDAAQEQQMSRLQELEKQVLYHANEADIEEDQGKEDNAARTWLFKICAPNAMPVVPFTPPNRLQKSRGGAGRKSDAA